MSSPVLSDQVVTLPPEAAPAGARRAPLRDELAYWLGLPLRWGYQIGHNGLGIVRVLYVTRFRPLPAGLIGPDHPWATGLNPATGRPIWHANVLYRSARSPSVEASSDEEIV